MTLQCNALDIVVQLLVATLKKMEKGSVKLTAGHLYFMPHVNS